MDKVTIIIPVYNSEEYIERCLDSVLQQTYKNLEILVMNDGSTDQSLSIIKRKAAENPNIRYYDQKNMGVAKTRNKAISLATGKYIMFMDNDDYFDQDYVATFVKAIEKDDFDVVIGGYRRITENLKILQEEKLKNKPFSKYLIMAPWAKIYKREFLLAHDFQFLDYVIGEDVYFSLSLYFSTDKIGIIDYIGYNWFFNTQSVSNTVQRGFRKEVDILFLLKKIRSLNGYQKSKVLDYYFTRYSIWYLLFSGKSATGQEFVEEYKRILAYFKKKKITRKVYFFEKGIKGEHVKNRFVVMVFLTLEKLHLVKLFAKLYCKGKKSL